MSSSRTVGHLVDTFRRGRVRWARPLPPLRSTVGGRWLPTAGGVDVVSAYVGFFETCCDRREALLRRRDNRRSIEVAGAAPRLFNRAIGNVAERIANRIRAHVLRTFDTLEVAKIRRVHWATPTRWIRRPRPWPESGNLHRRSRSQRYWIGPCAVDLPAESVGKSSTPSIERMVEFSTRYQTASIDSLQIFYREADDESKPTLLPLHGFPVSTRVFRRLEVNDQLFRDFGVVGVSRSKVRVNSLTENAPAATVANPERRRDAEFSRRRHGYPSPPRAEGPTAYPVLASTS